MDGFKVVVGVGGDKLPWDITSNEAPLEDK